MACSCKHICLINNHRTEALHAYALPMIFWQVTLKDFFFTGVTLITGRKSDTQRKVFTEHSTTLDLWPDSESNIIHVRLLSGHLTHIVG